MLGRLRRLVDRWFLRAPFEGGGALRYARDNRPAFGDLDERLAAECGLAGARTALDVGAGTGDLARRLAAAAPGARVIALEPSRTFTAAAARRPTSGVTVVRARAEALPLATGSVDVAVSVSALRHVRDRAAAFAELRRVVRPGGTCHVIELDAAAGAAQRRRHGDAVRTRRGRALFAWLILPTCPPAEEFAVLARAAGWGAAPIRRDAVQPVWWMRLT